MSKKRRGTRKAARPLPVWALPPSVPRSSTTSTPELEALIAHMLLLRYEHDIARLFSVHIDNIARKYLPKIMERMTLTAGSPGWCARHAGDEGIKDYFRSVVAMDLRQAGERVAPRSLEWSYTSLRHFALSNDVHICPSADHGLQSYRLLPHLSALQSYVKSLTYQPAPVFAPPPFKPKYSPKAFQDRLRTVLAPLTLKDMSIQEISQPWADWEAKAALGNERMVETLWAVAREFEPRGYGIVLKQKLQNWCDCGCSTEHLGEVCERTVREDEVQRETAQGKGGAKESRLLGQEHEDAPKREKGKGKEWDGRGGGILGWGTKDEEDMWEKSLDLGGNDDSEDWEDQMTMGEQMEWRYLKAEREKELGNTAYKLGKYGTAITYYLSADTIEPELPHYRLNAAQAHLQLGDWASAERLCTQSLKQHPASVKALWRRAKARKMLGKVQGAARDLRVLLATQPWNREAREALESLAPQLPANRNRKGALGASDAHALHAGCSCAYASGSSSSPTPAHTQLHSHSHASSSSSSSTCTALTAPSDSRESPVPFELDEYDHTKLSIACVPVSLVMPDTAKDEGFAYPSWERYKVERVD